MDSQELAKQSRLLHKKVPGKLHTELAVDIYTMADLSLAYSPGVGVISKDIAENPKLCWEMTGRGHTIAVISDGSAVLGLGNIGPLAAMPVMEGKAALFKKFGGLDAVPLCLNTQKTEEIITIVQSLEPSFGAINLEDISAPRCFEIEETLQKTLSIPIMHDDQWGTAIVVLAGLINSCTVTNRVLPESHIVVAGAGAAGIAICKLLLAYGANNITLCDSKGIITKENASNKYKSYIIENSSAKVLSGSISDALINADIFIGVSAPNTITETMVESMSKNPIVFALSNPVPEIMPELAHRAGAGITATGRSDYPNQINNALVFPQLFAHCIKTQIQFTMDIYIEAAKNLANTVKNPTNEYIVPTIFEDYKLF